MHLKENCLELLNFIYYLISPFISYALFPLGQSNCMMLGGVKKNLFFRVGEAFFLVIVISILAL